MATILEDLAEHRAARIAYDGRILELFMAPLPEHEHNKEIISLGSTTCKNELLAQGIEPEQCFYITN